MGAEPHCDRRQIERILSRNDGAIVLNHCNLPNVLCRPGNRAQCLALGSKLTNCTEIAGALEFVLQAIGPCAAEWMRRFQGRFCRRLNERIDSLS